jgi:pyruvate dehydrogenase E2 component (dihydrolipoamide acetyltransferase)
VTRVEYALPDVGEGLQEAEIVTWRIAPGDTVQEDQVLVEIETDKSVVEIPSPYEGTVVRLGGAQGDIVPVGALLVEFEIDAETGAPARPAPSGDGNSEAAHDADAAIPGAGPHDSGGDTTAPQAIASPPASQRVLASPSTRRRAVELGVSLEAVEGTGPDGRVTRDDVESAAGAASPDHHGAAAGTAAHSGAPSPRATPSPQTRTEPLRGVRRRIAQTMTQTLQIPAINEWRDVDATELMATHRRLRDHLAVDGVRLTLLPVVLKATAAALRAHPRFNASIDMDNEEIIYHGRIDIGVATATPDGLQVPVIRHVDQRSLADLAGEIDRLAMAARERTLGPADAADGTCTVSNFGSFGTIRGAPLIRPPEVAIVGVGRIHDAVVAVDRQPVVRPILPLVVSTDHRLNDGNHLAAFCDTLVGYLTDPTLLLVV